MMMVWLFSGEHLYTPDIKSLQRDVRNEMILRDYDKLVAEGVTRADKIVGARYGLNPHYIFRIVRKTRKAKIDRQ